MICLKGQFVRNDRIFSFKPSKMTLSMLHEEKTILTSCQICLVSMCCVVLCCVVLDM